MPKRPITTEEIPVKKSKTSHWSLGLLQAVEDPELLVKSDDHVTVIKDKYPKSTFHYLIICKKDIKNLNSVTKNDIDLLKHMEEEAVNLAKELKHDGYHFKIGFHAEPSMLRLHLHVLSDDMNSPHLKTKKHWNSYNTKFFIKSGAIIEDLIQNGRTLLPSSVECKSYLESPLKCHKCTFVPKHMPDLKKHILDHL